MHPSLHSIRRGGAVDVVGSRAGHRIDVLVLIQHLSIVVVKFSLREGLYCLGGGSRKIHIPECDDPFPTIDRGISNVAGPLASCSNSCQVELVAGSSITDSTQNMSGHDHDRGGDGYVLYEIPSGII